MWVLSNMAVVGNSDVSGIGNTRITTQGEALKRDRIHRIPVYEYWCIAVNVGSLLYPNLGFHRFLCAVVSLFSGSSRRKWFVVYRLYFIVRRRSIVCSFVIRSSSFVCLFVRSLFFFALPLFPFVALAANRQPSANRVLRLKTVRGRTCRINTREGEMCGATQDCVSSAGVGVTTEERMKCQWPNFERWRR